MKSTWSPPTEFEEFRLVRVLGEGAMGTVWLAHDKNLDRAVAVKLISAAEPGEGARERFLIEARAIARLHHPNVVTIFRVGLVEGRPYLVTELLTGTALDQLPRPLDPALATELALGLARGLAAAHRRGVLHRDIKPANAFLTAEREVKLIDFGIAELQDIGPAPEVEGSAGTPAYLSPEQWVGEPASPRTDVYALGATLFQLLSGRLPHEARSLMELAREVTQNDAPKLASVAPALPERLCDVVDRCLARDPDARYATADAVRTDLERVAREAATRELPPGNPYRGLHVFGPEHRRLFFGREIEVADLVERLRSEAWVVVAGRSGAGKSSMVRAGAIPLVLEGALNERAGAATEWKVATMVPGPRPLDALVAACAPIIGRPEAEVAAEVAADPAWLARALRGVKGRAVLLAIDQMEELVTMADVAQLRGFADALRHLVTFTPGLRVVSTVRSDFLGHFAPLAELHRELTRAVHVVGPMTPEGVRDAIVGPAGLMGYSFEAEEDVDRLVAAVENDPGSLPLLSFALAQLWDRRDEAKKVIPRAAIEQIGGVSGALARHAEDVLAAMPPAAQRETRRLFARLVTPEGTRARRTLEELVPGPETKDVLEALVRGRLLATAEDETYEVTHEALLTGWSRLREWLDDAKEARRVRARLEHAAAEWARLGRPREVLWRGKQIFELASVGDERIGETAAAFAAASRSAERRARWVRIASIVAVPTVLLGSILGANALAQRRARMNADAMVARASAAVSEARPLAQRWMAMRRDSIAAYEAGLAEAGLAVWREAERLRRDADRLNEMALDALSEALAKVAAYPPAERLATDLWAERLVDAEETVDVPGAASSLRMLRLHDHERRRRDLYPEPRAVAIDSDPTGAMLKVARLDLGGSRLIVDWTSAPVHLLLEPGTYLVSARRAGSLDTTYAWALRARGEDRLNVPLRQAETVPDGFVYIAGGEVVVGSTNDEFIESGLAVPAHWKQVKPFLIRRTETSIREWIAYLRTLPAEVVQEYQSTHQVLVRQVDGRFKLDMALLGHPGQALSEDEPLVLTRHPAKSVDWRDLAMTAVSVDDALEFAQASGARLCTEVEWEAAARGADGRIYPHGSTLDAHDASWALTDGAQLTRLRMWDPVGQYPSSRSIFGVDDMAGNVHEWTATRTVDGLAIVKSGAWSSFAWEVRSDVRKLFARTFFGTTIGFRVCRD